MDWFISALITGAIAFSATNLDDILLLTFFFSQTARKRHVVVGQYLGFSALMLVSLIGFFGGRALPHEWIRWLGIAPIFLGLKNLIATRGNVQPSGSNALGVATVTFTNGADNIGVYTALFTVSDARKVVVLTGVLYSLLAVWCLIAYLIHRQQVVAKMVSTYGHRLVPFILIALGLYIAVSICNPDCPPPTVQGRDAAPTPTRFLEIVSDDFPVLHTDGSAYFVLHTAMTK